EQRSLEPDNPKGYPLSNLKDNNLQTAWLLPATDLAQNGILIIRFPKPTLVVNLGIAIGYQKSRDDALQDRYAMYQKPGALMIRTLEGSAQKVNLINVKGVQYPSFRPVETQEIRLEMRDLIPGTSPNAALAISEIRLIGLPLDAE
ncbi:MAG TPA: serine/threonine protein kinase, partial [Fibrobacteraceae bacterium]|nr:serine/threonine protein kinase [Fibrobacteraceae bacterium]